MARESPVSEIEVFYHFVGEIFVNAVLAGVVYLDQPLDCLLALDAVESGQHVLKRTVIALVTLGRQFR